MIDQTIFIPRYANATLYRQLEDDGGLQYVEGPRLLRDFHVGGSTKVGSIFARTFGNDWWQTSNIREITKIETKDRGLAQIYYRTRNTPYVLEVSVDDITYRDDLGALIDVSLNDYGSDNFLVEAKAFKEIADAEHDKRIEKDQAKAARQASGEAEG